MPRFFSFLSLFILLSACGTREIDTALIGHWKAHKSPITVRTEPQRMEFIFTRDSADFELNIDEAFNVSGRIGEARFSHGSIHCNWLFPTKMTGIAYTLHFNLEGEIFPGDPLNQKEVELWLGPKFDDAEWELRYTKGASKFPMAFPIFRKVD